MSEDGEVLIKTETSIAEVKAIEESRGQMFMTRGDISRYVEPPLVSACEHLWDLNVLTLGSSANAKDIGRDAYIRIDYDSLSDENKIIAEQKGLLDHSKSDHGITAVYIRVPVTNETTIEQVKQQTVALTECFKKQRASWIPSYPLEQMRKMYGIDPKDNKYMAEDFIKEGYYYDSERQKFYLSEEHFKKANEEIK